MSLEMHVVRANCMTGMSLEMRVVRADCRVHVCDWNES